MFYPRYFKPGHKFYLQSVAHFSDADCFESLSATLEQCQDLDFDLIVPAFSHWQGELPFAGGTAIELVSETLGVAVRITAHYQQRLSQSVIRLRSTGNLEFFCRRSHIRIDVSASLGFMRCREDYATLHRSWTEWAHALQGGTPAAQLVPMKESRFNVSASGLRIEVEEAPSVGDLFLVVFQLEGGRGPVCVLSEVVWAGEVKREETGLCSARMRFVNIREEDRVWVGRYVWRRWWSSQPASPV